MHMYLFMNLRLYLGNMRQGAGTFALNSPNQLWRRPVTEQLRPHRGEIGEQFLN